MDVCSQAPHGPATAGLVGVDVFRPCMSRAIRTRPKTSRWRDLIVRFYAASGGIGSASFSTASSSAACCGHSTPSRSHVASGMSAKELIGRADQNISKCRQLAGWLPSYFASYPSQQHIRRVGIVAFPSLRTASMSHGAAGTRRNRLADCPFLGPSVPGFQPLLRLTIKRLRGIREGTLWSGILNF